MTLGLVVNLVVALALLTSSCVAYGSVTEKSLSILAPATEGRDRIEKNLPAYDPKVNLFRSRPTQEAAERLRDLDRVIQEKLNFQTVTQRDLFGYYWAKRDLALWYARALLRAQVSAWITGARKYFRDERIRSQLQKQARDQHYTARGVNSNDEVHGLSSQSWQSSNEEEDSRAQALMLKFLAEATQFIEQFTNSGVTAVVSRFSASMRLDIQSAVLDAQIRSPFLQLGMAYHLRPGEKPVPFSGTDPVAGIERMVLSGAGSIPFLAVNSAVNYQYLHQNLSCALSRQIIGPVNGQVERSWNVAGLGSAPDSRASLTMSMNF